MGQRESLIKPLVTLLVALILCPGIQAQRDGVRKGLWMTVGYGYGSGRFNCDNCAGPQYQDGDLFQASVGWAVAPQLIALAEYRFWSNGPSGASGRMRSVTIGAAVYPFKTKHMFIRAGAGEGGFREGPYNGSGTGYVIATGWDVSLTASLAVTPELGYAFGYLGPVRVGSRTATDGWRQSVLAFSIGLTVR